MNTVLANAQAEGRIPGSVYDVLYLENEAGYILENLNPTAEGYYYAWDQANNKIIYLMSDLQTVYYPEDYTLTEANCWITVSNAAEAAKIAGYGYNLALECDIDEEIVLSNVVSINTLGFKAGNIIFNGDSSSKSVQTAYMIGTFGNIGGTLGASSIVQSGTATNFNVSSNNAASSVTVSGYVNSFSVSGSAAASVTSAGLVNTVASTNTSSINSNGVVVHSNGSSVVGGTSVTKDNKVQASTKEDLESIRLQVASGLRNFSGETIELTQDINMNGIAFTPISSYYRKAAEDVTGKSADAWFSGTIDGKNYSIQNLSNKGFSIAGITAGTNGSSVQFGESRVTYSEAIYGLFASVRNATIKNVTITVDIDMMIDNQNQYVGDSVGGLIGFSMGDLTLENITVNGSVRGYDGVGGIVGRCYADGDKKTITLKNVTNNADVTGARHTGGIIGFASGVTISFENCVNNGTIKNLGHDYDKNVLGAKDSSATGGHNGVGYYHAAAAYTGKCVTAGAEGVNTTSFTKQYLSDNGVSSKAQSNNYCTGKLPGFTNNGKMYIGDVQVQYLTQEADYDYAIEHK
ncbi:MAG: hypothetical protein K6B54_04880 [Clostridia bacterium]|nr:hypothetical protein [Clostridia bacterium]